MADRQTYGRESEEAACKYLKRHGHRILERNFHGRHGEIDIISLEHRQTLVFCEVRARHSADFVHPLETITPAKQMHVRQTAQVWLYRHPEYTNTECRFDVITVVGEGKKAVLTHLKDAF
jgi:putative endonuclease